MSLSAIEFLSSDTCGLPHRRRQSRLYAMLQAFIDDSGSEPQSPIFVLCGFVSTKERWDEFTRQWDNALLNSPKPLAYFKMVEANSLKGQFDGWTPEERDQKLAELASIIQDNVMFAVRTAILWRVYKEVQAQYPEHVYEPYQHLFYSVMWVAVRHVMALPHPEKVEFIFDEQGMAGKQARRGFEEMKSILPPEQIAYIGYEPRHRSEEEFIPPQAADMYAWQNRRFIADEGNYSSPTLVLLDQIPVEEFVIDRLNLTVTYEDLRINFPSNTS